MKDPWESEVLIIGAGIIGASIARELSQYKVKTAVVEKSPDGFTGQTKSSHGLVYSGRSLNMAFSLVLKSIMAPEAQFRTRAGMGRCQRGFCGPRVVEILARELGIPQTRVTFKGPGSEILKYQSKELLH
ncbi:MAG: hypothetical protein A2169_12260 [Deltaproteobacteria bacterium RBG_13_47_9]|nr:MAG: hypothetical protein A2169_12260 [Deltaproteobacteria bacterium RBG_13_47_9]